MLIPITKERKKLTEIGNKVQSELERRAISQAPREFNKLFYSIVMEEGFDINLIDDSCKKGACNTYLADHFKFESVNNLLMYLAYIRKNFRHEFKEDPEEGDFALYFKGNASHIDKKKHIGYVNNNRLVSKWGDCNFVYDCPLELIPTYYGTKIYFIKSPGQFVKEYPELFR